MGGGGGGGGGGGSLHFILSNIEDIDTAIDTDSPRAAVEEACGHLFAEVVQ